MCYLIYCCDCYRFGHWEFFPLVHVSLLHMLGCFVCLFVLSTSLLFGTTWCSRFILYVAYPSPRISHFSKEPQFLLWKNGIRNQDMGTGCAHCRCRKKDFYPQFRWEHWWLEYKWLAQVKDLAKIQPNILSSILLCKNTLNFIPYPPFP